MRVRSILVALGLLAIFVLAILWGMGGQETAQGAGSSLFGDGSDGAKVYSVNETDAPKDAVVDSGAASSTTLVVSGVGAGFVTGEKILIHQTRGTGAGNWELNEVQSYALGNITTVSALSNSYSTGGPSDPERAQVYVVPEYTDLTVNSGVTVTAKAWDGSTGGIFAVFASGTATIAGTINAQGQAAENPGKDSRTGGVGIGFHGGTPGSQNRNPASQGEGVSGAGVQSTSANGSGGGGAAIGTTDNTGGIGGGGGNGTAGLSGTPAGNGTGGAGGSTSGSADLTTMTFGGGGGGGSYKLSSAPDARGGGGGGGGGIIAVFSATIAATGSISASGGSGLNNDAFSGGGGAGGSILLRGQNVALGTASITAAGAVIGGGDGRIRAEYCDSISGGIADPPASVAQISCGPKPTPTITPTPTKLPFKGDTDGDGCPDVNENLPKADVANGGGRDYLDPYDYYSVNNDSVIDLLVDILGVIQHYAPGGDPPYDATYVPFDRGPTTGPNPWNMTAPDGKIDLLTDILGVIQQYSPGGCT